ncbi:receptor kinase-like protein Xa21 [Eucalyptus grandis]|uniref:receptor kinase-like protein Xa21 n=1 Tax=Eucalyptus grandis TaxID=71139 RepID=UPI00192E9738|nr:receptor kinase-like protein Xa21 [Eucalyptus grandis]
MEVDPTNTIKGNNWTVEANFCEWIGVVCSNRRQRVIALDLSHMGLQGRLSPYLGNLSLLTSLDLRNNSFYGMILIEIGHLSRLKELILELNQFEGNIPHILTQCQNLEVMSLATNRLTGGIPREFGAFRKLQQLNLSSNDLQGQIPSFRGSISQDIDSLQKLQKLYISANNLTGMIPRTIGNMSSLHKLDIGSNQIEGEIPSEIGNLVNLERMSLGVNLLTREVPREIRGCIPKEMGFLKRLTFLELSDNALDGNIPSSIGGLERLQRLYLDNNHLEGLIPNEICNLTGLGELLLQQNRISGSIPKCIENLSSLQMFLISLNNMISVIPLSLWGLQELIFLNLSHNSFNGRLPLEIGKMRAIESIDLSWNRLTGAIPSSIQEFESLALLNLSRNSFQGSIPQSIGHLKGLEFLDLSYNELSGMIPESLEALAFLQILNLSFNKLSGEIPNGGHFGNFSALSFIENEALCGNAIFQVPCCKVNGMKSRDKRLHILYITVPIVSVILLVLIICLLRKHGATSEKALVLMLVYKGTLANGIDIAVKVLNLHIEGALKSFDAECDAFRMIRHRNLVKVISTCTNANLRALVLQYVPCGSLEKWLYSNNYNLDLLQRVKIMANVATAIEYLHHGQPEPIVHCDLKPSNILLNKDLVAQVCDFGIAKILAENKLETQTRTLGTIGYIAPEYGSEGKVSTKGDVYSFGILLLEVITGKKPIGEMSNADISLRQWVGASIPERVLDIVDTKILRMKHEDPTLSKFNSIVLLILELGLECSKDLPGERMDMKTIMVKLNKIKLSLP